MTKNKSFQSPSAKPVDVEYRLKRLRATLGDSLMFLESIDPGVFPTEHASMLEALNLALTVACAVKAPAKKARKSEADKASAAEAKEAARLAKAAEKEAAKAEKKKAAREAAATAKLKADAAALVVESKDDGTVVAKPGSAIERALAAAKARKAAKKEAA